MSTRISLIGARVDLELPQGATWRETLTLLADGLPVDLSGSVVRGQVRHAALDADPPAAIIAVSVLDAAAGRVELLLTDEQTAALPCGPRLSDPASQYEWDLEVEDAGGDVRQLLQGLLRLKAGVTR